MSTLPGGRMSGHLAMTAATVNVVVDTRPLPLLVPVDPSSPLSVSVSTPVLQRIRLSMIPPDTRKVLGLVHSTRTKLN